MLPAWEVPDALYHAFYGDLPHDIDIPDASLWHVFADTVAAHSQTPAVKFLGSSLTYREVYIAVEELATGLKRLGVKRGDRVIIDVQNCPQFVIAYFAVLRLDGVVVPVNPMYRGAELAHLISNSGAKYAIAQVEIVPWLCEASDSLDEGLEAIVTIDVADAVGGREAVVRLDIPQAWKDWLTAPVPSASSERTRVVTWADALIPSAVPAVDVVNRGADVAQIVYTSGTSGTSKGCTTLHSALVHQALAGPPWHDMHAGDAGLIVIPMIHVTGLVQGLLMPFSCGGTAVILPRWDRDYALQTIVREDVTHWFNVPTMVIDLLGSPSDFVDDAMNQLRVIGGGGTAMPKPIEDRLRDEYGLNYCTGYGMSETSAGITIVPLQAPKSGTVGVPYFGMEVRIIDSVSGPIDVPTEMPLGESGEIIVRGPQVTPGYWGNSAATEEATVELDGKSFLRTGDVGFIDNEGYLTLTERLKRLINAAGFKVSPAEIEQVLFEHEAVREACVIRTTHPRRGESVKAVIVLKDGWADRITEADFIAWSRERMAAYKYPRVVEFVDALPYNATGKLMWRELQEEHDARDADTAARGATELDAQKASQ